ncbi:hypothetical protein JYK13_21755 [Citrobacter sp. ku-bf4]|uniref:hypothetical protein n=1 Tax=Citrobacter TaxID=544 RepID=UPI001982090B|nr:MULTISPECIES: hypothetical protein [Citrobacter]MBN6046605.1 hypothetical protein [Citrobacter sp. ku-bf4]MBS0827981.1 hypothetical protein [Citrobacter amalonaticus]
MDNRSLVNFLINNNYPKDSYSVLEVKNESLCLIKENEIWIIFYSERGQRSDPKYYSNEDVACHVFIDELNHMLRYL